MNHEQKATTQAMLELYNSIVALQAAAVKVKALHWQTITGYQRDVVISCINFAYADSEPPIPARKGDATYFDYDKFVMLFAPNEYKEKKAT